MTKVIGKARKGIGQKSDAWDSSTVLQYSIGPHVCGKGRMKRLWHIFATDKYLVLLGIEGAGIGILVGLVDVLFGRVLNIVSALRIAHPFWFIPFLPLAGVGIIYLNRFLGGNNHKGMTGVFDIGLEKEAELPLTIIPFVIVATWMTNLCGGSSGREGVAVQIGAILAYHIGQKIKGVENKRIFLVAGIAAGFGGLLGTPIAATCFALEVIVAGQMKYQALFPALIGSISAMEISHLFGLSKFSYTLKYPMTFSIRFIGQLILLGVIFGLVGGGFAWCMKQARKRTAQLIPNPLYRIVIGGMALSVVFMLLHAGRYSGMGLDLISDALGEKTIYPYDWILKFVLTILTLAVGFQGGELVPLFSIGASLGALLAVWMGLPVDLVAALGYAAVFGSATNTLFAPVLLGGEIFGYQYTPAFFIVCSVAYIFNMNQTIYGKQKLLEELHPAETAPLQTPAAGAETGTEKETPPVAGSV